MNIRKLIREVLENNFNKQNSEKNFIQDIVYLKNFELNKKEEVGHSTLWVFQNKIKDYTIRFYIQKNNYFGTWFAKLYIYWKIPTRHYTNAKGKDFDYKFGPYDSYNEMVSHLNNRLENNPLISTGNFVDDNKTQLDKDTFELLKLVKKRSTDIKKVNDKNFNELKKVEKEIENINDEKGLKDYMEIKTEEWEKQTFWLVLNKIFDVDFFINKEHIESLF